MRRSTSLTASSRSTELGCPPHAAWAVVASGGEGPQWYVDAWPFVVRGGLDRLLGGAGRAHQPPGRALLQPGDRVGFWRVAELDRDTRLLRLVAQVRAPGTVELLTSVTPTDSGCRVSQSVRLRPSGLLGAAYLAVDLPARELVIELTHRRLLADLRVE